MNPHTPGNGGVGLYAIDVELPIGTPLVAARAGIVVAVRDTFEDGNGRDLGENYVMVRHKPAGRICISMYSGVAPTCPRGTTRCPVA